MNKYIIIKGIVFSINKLNISQYIGNKYTLHLLPNLLQMVDTSSLLPAAVTEIENSVLLNYLHMYPYHTLNKFQFGVCAVVE